MVNNLYYITLTIWIRILKKKDIGGKSGVNKKNNTMNYDIVALYMCMDDFRKIYEEVREKEADRSNKM